MTISKKIWDAHSMLSSVRNEIQEVREKAHSVTINQQDFTQAEVAEAQAIKSLTSKILNDVYASLEHIESAYENCTETLREITGDAKRVIER